MSTRHHRPSRAPRYMLRALSALLICYFAYHGLHGDHGLQASTELNTEIKQLEAELTSTRQTRESLEQRVVLLRDATLDGDLLDERLRAVLNYAHPNDIVVATHTRTTR